MNGQSKVTMVKAGAIISLIEGILLCLTLIGIPLGIFCIIGYNRLKEIYSKPTAEAVQDINSSKYFGWTIYILIVTFPLGLLSFLPYVLTDNSNSTNNNQ